MNAILMYIAIGFGCLLLCLVIPGVKVLAEAVIKILIDLLTELFKHKGAFGVWFVKTVVADHLRLLQHAVQTRDEIDPTVSIRYRAEGYDEKD